MQKVDERFLIHGHIHGFYLTPRQLTEILGCSDRHARTIINGVREQITKGRYNRYAILDSGDIRVNIYAYYDYEKYRRLLNDKNACKVVPPFNPLELAALCPVVERVIAVDVERAGYIECIPDNYVFYCSDHLLHDPAAQIKQNIGIHRSGQQPCNP